MNGALIRLINNIKLGYINKKAFILVPNKKICINFIQILYQEGFINFYEILSSRYIKIYLKYIQDIPIIQYINLISKPSRTISYKYRHMFYRMGLPLLKDLTFIKRKIKKIKIKKFLGHLNIKYLNHLNVIKTLLKHKNFKQYKFLM